MQAGLNFDTDKYCLHIANIFSMKLSNNLGSYSDQICFSHISESHFVYPTGPIIFGPMILK